MKHQFYFDHVERDLLITALEVFDSRMNGETANPVIREAARFTQRRIKEMLIKLKAPDAKKAVP